MPFSDVPYDRKTADLMARALDDALATASLKVMGLSEVDWTEMHDAITSAVAGGLRDAERLKQIALDALDKRREILCREVVASSISFEPGATLAGLPLDRQGAEHEGEGKCRESATPMPIGTGGLGTAI